MSETVRDTFQRTPAPYPPIEIAFPDLAPYAAGNDRTPYVWTFAGEQPGPHILVQALTHGNEVCGAIALDWLLREEIRPTRGTLTLVFANVGAYLRFDRADPFESRCVDEDFNRLWTREVLDGPRRSAELARARELRPIVDRTDHLLDLHSMSEPCPPLAMAGRQRKGVELAKAIGVPQHIVIDGGHVAGQRLRDYAFFDDPADARSALLVECGQHWEAAAPRVATTRAQSLAPHRPRERQMQRPGVPACIRRSRLWLRTLPVPTAGQAGSRNAIAPRLARAPVPSGQWSLA